MKQIFVKISEKRYSTNLDIYLDRNKKEKLQFLDIPYGSGDASAVINLLTFLRDNKFLSIVAIDDKTMKYFQ